MRRTCAVHPLMVTPNLQHMIIPVVGDQKSARPDSAPINLSDAVRRQFDLPHSNAAGHAPKPKLVLREYG